MLQESLSILQVPSNCLIQTERTLSFPISQVYEAWTNVELLKAWWGPEGFTNTFLEYDFKEGGRTKFYMHGPDGANYLNECTFVSIEPEKLLVWNHDVNPLFQFETRFEKTDETHTHVVFMMKFLDAVLCAQVAAYAVGKNEENFDKLERLLKK